MAQSRPSLLKNTIILYVRAVFIMFIGFYITRLTLMALGVDDYGMVNVVGSVVAMFTVISNVMNTATSRYYNVEIAQHGQEGLRRMFNISFQLYTGLAIIFFICAETIGLWLFYDKLALPESKQNIAFWYYQMTILTACLNLYAVPYVSMIIAKEDMGYFAIVSTADALVKVAGVALLCLCPTERVLWYGFLFILIAFGNLWAYLLICRRRFGVYRPERMWDGKKLWEVSKFGGWNMWGAGGVVASNALVNVLLNNYFGVVVNAARAVAVQISVAANMFVSNFLTACNPRIVKLHAESQREECHKLTCNASRYCFLLSWVVVAPLWLLAPELLGIWLSVVPPFTILFTRLVLIQALIDSASYPLMVLAQATGKIAFYQFSVGILLMLNLPLSWIAIQLTHREEACFYVAIGIAFVGLFARLLILRHIDVFSLKRYGRYCFFRCVLIVSLCMGTLALMSCTICPASDYGLFSVWTYVYFFLVFCITAFIGVNRSERMVFINHLRRKIGAKTEEL
ncbi:MAG: lipopolysaccharide biosynthesis protein [Akkermansia sp.]|nr:lipopolysaccharide biosynthesis protein [Akkermansia sp.]